MTMSAEEWEAMERERHALLKQSIQIGQLSQSGPVCFVRRCTGFAKILHGRFGFCDDHADRAAQVVQTFREQEVVAEARLAERLRDLQGVSDGV